MANQSVKIVFESEPRRTSVEFFDFANFRNFCSQVRSLYKRDFAGLEEGSAFVVTYVDDEGDNITVKSDEELQTSVHSQGPGLLKYTVTQRSPPPGDKAALPLPSAPERSPLEFLSGKTATWKSVFASVRKGFESTEVNTRAVRMMDMGDFSAAREALKNGIQKFASDSRLHYNLACVESVCGNLKEAVESLGNAVACGYSDATHMLSDPDLANLLQSRFGPSISELFHDLHGKASSFTGLGHNVPRDASAGSDTSYTTQDQSVSTTTAEVTQSTSSSSADSPPPPVVPQLDLSSIVVPSAPQPAPFPYSQPLADLVQMGFSPAAAKEALLQSKGDINVAIDTLMSSL